MLLTPSWTLTKVPCQEYEVDGSGLRLIQRSL